jgi:hypothetical protein
MPHESRPARAWHRLTSSRPGEHAVDVELRPESTVWVRVKGRLAVSAAEHLATGLREALQRTEDRLVLDLRRLFNTEPGSAERIAAELRAYRQRIRVVLPLTGEMAGMTALFALYR